MLRDPACGIRMNPQNALAICEHDGKTFYCYSKDRVDKFDANPYRNGHTEEPEQHDRMPETQRRIDRSVAHVAGAAVELISRPGIAFSL